MRSLGVLPISSIVLFAQTGAVAPDWDIRTILQEMSAYATRLGSALDRVDTSSWKDASETYAAQLQSSKDQARALADGAKTLARKPEVLSQALELYFRLNGLDNMMLSLQEGVRRYQSPAIADMLARVAGENGANRDRFLRYIIDLAAQREQQFIVMDHEAQRCRGDLSKQPVEIPRNRKK